MTRSRLFKTIPLFCLAAMVLSMAPVSAQTAAELRAAQEPRFRLDESGALVPDVRSAAAIIYDPGTGQVLWESNSQAQRSMASITKIMTAVVLLEDTRDLADFVTIAASDVRNASVTYLRQGDRITRQDLLHLLLIASDNGAARALARASSYGAEGFVYQMNEKAADLGLQSTRYADPSGLLAANVSSAYDIARLITHVSADDRIAGIMRKPQYTATAGRRPITINTTNRLMREGMDVQAGKTGFIRMAGYCLATLLRLSEDGPQVAVVVLGAPNSITRFWETRHLFNWMSVKADDLRLASVTP